MKQLVNLAFCISCLCANTSLGQYQLDDNQPELIFGVDQSVHSWGNIFTVIPGAENLESLELAFGFHINGGTL
ncbi:MAG: hypothetical protein AAGA30_15745, partial [Planctomycetota bacterium]